MELIRIARQLSEDLRQLRFAPPVTHVYDPLDYAWEAHERYLQMYGVGAREVVLLGMNPGPFGMAQTGVPFGDVTSVRTFLGIDAQVGRPAAEHPRRPVLGFDSSRREVSGRRLWGWAQETWGSAGAFFERFFVANYCPLCFLEASGRNRTPDKLRAAERAALYRLCDRALRRSVEQLCPRYVVGVGAFAETRARDALDGMELAVGRILHPSPANPRANRGWASSATSELADLGIAI